MAIGLGLKAQDMATVGAKWWYKLYCYTSPDCGYFTMSVTKDTVIGGVTARFIEKEVFGGESWTSYDTTSLIAYSNDKKFYIFDDINNEFYILYDFNLQAGDTLTIQDSSKYRGFYNIVGGTDIAFFQVVIDSNVVKQRGNYSLIHLYTSPTPNSSYFFNGPIVEYLGNIFSMFGEPTIMTPGGYPGYLRCYKDHYIDLTHDNCEYITNSGIVFLEEDTYNIYPNPFTDSFQIEGIDNHSIKEVNIFDSFGRLQKTVLNENRISMPNAASGIYFISILIEKDGVLSEKKLKIFKL